MLLGVVMVIKRVIALDIDKGFSREWLSWQKLQQRINPRQV
jgi:hypothetical protein